MLGDVATAAADLDESEDLCERSGLRLHLADTHLYRARLFKDRAALEKARAVIHACGYGRRLPELADADEAAKTWP